MIKIANKKKSTGNNNSDFANGCMLIIAAIALLPYFLSFVLSKFVWTSKRSKLPKFLRGVLIVLLWVIMLLWGLAAWALQTNAKDTGTTSNAMILFWAITVCTQALACLFMYEREPEEKPAPPVEPEAPDTDAVADTLAATLTPRIVFDGYEDTPAPAPAPAAHPKPRGLPPLCTRAPAELADLKKLHDYVVVDTETTGLNHLTDEMIEIAIITVVGDQTVEEYSTLIHPMVPVSAQASAVNGLTEADLIEAPRLADVLPEIRRRLDGKTIIGHNVTFDLGFISDALAAPERPADLCYIDTMNLSRQCVPAKTHKLQALAAQLGLDPGQAHRALGDARTTLQLYQYCVNKLDADAAEERRLRAERRRIKQAAHDAEFSWSPLNNKNFAFSGDFLTDRERLEGLVLTVGANLRTEVNTKTDYLVTGDLTHLPDWALARKSGKADSLKNAGQNLTKLTEAEYIALIQSTTALKPAAETGDFNQ